MTKLKISEKPIKTKMVMKAKFIVLAICALIATLSVPHVSLWGFSFGSGVGAAAETIDGIRCSQQINNNAGCLKALSNKYDIFICNAPNAQTNTWVPSSNSNERDFATLRECNNKCRTSYETRCITSSGTINLVVETEINGYTSGSINVDKDSPIQVKATIYDRNSQAIESEMQLLRFELSGPSVVGVNPLSGFNYQECVDPDGAQQRYECTFDLKQHIMQSGSYRFIVLRGSTALRTVTIIFSESGTAPSSTNRCCVELSGNRYTYTGKSRADCQSDSAVTRQYYSNSCSDAQRSVCSDVCRAKSYGSGGSCTIVGGEYDSSRTLDNVCDNNIPCVCSGQRQYNPQNVECNEACLTSDPYSGFGTYGVYSPFGSQSASSIPWGMCTSNPRAFIIAQSTISQSGVQGSSVAQRPARVLPGPPGSYRCESDESCVCTYLDISSFTANKRTPVTSLPGTQRTPRWNPPDRILNPPTKQPNEHACENAINAKITASFGAASASGASVKLFAAGDTVTITGKVEKLSDTCKGYKFTCRTQEEVDCETKRDAAGLWGILNTKLEHQPCPANLPEEVHKADGGRKWNKRFFVGAVELAAGLLIPGSSAFLDLLAQVGAGTTISGGLDGALCGTAGEGAGSQVSAAYYFAMAQQDRQQGQRGGTTVVIPTGGGGQQQPGGGQQPSGGSTGTNDNTQCAQACQSADPDFSYGLCENTPGEFSSLEGAYGCTPGNYCNCYGTAQCTATCKTWPRHAYTYGLCKALAVDTSGGDVISEFGRLGCASNSRCFCYAGTPTGRATSSPTFEITGKSSVPTTPLPTSTGSTSPTGASGATSGGGGGIFSGFGDFNPYSAVVGAAQDRIPACPSQEDRDKCFSVCGKTYETAVAPAPTCVGPVIAAKEATYKCGLGSCGPFASKRVKIDIRDPAGAPVITAETTTDANGDFSYTFQAPAGDGEFIAVLSVPKE